MKRILLLMSLTIGLSFSSMLVAQNQVGFYVIPLAAYSLDKSVDNYKTTTGLSYAVGGDYIYFMDKKSSNRLIGGRLANEVRARHAVRVGIYFNSVNLAWKAHYSGNFGADVEHKGTKHLKIIKIPIAWQYTIPFSYRVKLKMFTGPQFGYLVHAKGGLVHSDAQTGYFDLPEYKNSERSKYFNTFTVDWVAALGVYIHVTKWWNAVALARVEYTINNVEKKADFAVKNSDPPRSAGIYEDNFTPKTNPMNIGLMIGAEYRFHRAAHSRTKF